MKRRVTRHLSMLLALSLFLSIAFIKVPTVRADSAIPSVGSVTEAGAYLRQQMKNRATTIKFYYTASMPSGTLKSISEEAVKHTGVSDEGDFISWQTIRYGASSEWVSTSEGNKIQVTYTADYYTTKSEEDALTSKIQTVMNNLNLSGKSDYDKVKLIYDYITTHVSYDEENKGKSPDVEKLHFSAYAALVKGKAVCQGYATLFYRMALKAGVPCRFIKGFSVDQNGNQVGHGWNIVKIDGKYYYVDSTWDSYYTPSTYHYFLKGSTNMLQDHSLDSNYTNIYNQYNISTTDYVKPTNLPTDVYAQSAAYNAIKLQWSLPSGATSINVYYSTSQNGTYSLAGTYTGTSATISNLTMGKTYYFKLKAVLSNGDTSEFTSPVSARPVPSAPYNVKATTTGYTTVEITWNTKTPVRFVEVWRASKANAQQSEYIQLGIYNASDNKSISKNLTPGGTYYYKLRGYAYDNNDKKVFSGYSTIVKATAKVFAAPTLVSAVPQSADTVKINWTASSDTQFVEVWRTHLPNAEQKNYVMLGIYYASSGSSFSRKLTSGKTYYYKLRGYSYDSYNKKFYSGYSAVVKATPHS